MQTVQKQEKKIEKDHTQLLIKCEYYVQKNTEHILPTNEVDFNTCSILKKKKFSIKLLHTLPNDWALTFNNESLQNHITDAIVKKEFLNIQTFYTNKQNNDYITKLILLKATLNEINIVDYLNSFSRKRKLSTIDSLRKEEADGKPEKKTDKFQYMGDNPVVVFSSKDDDDIEIKLIVSTVPKSFNFELVYPKDIDIYERVNSRIQKILDVLNEKNIFEGIFRLLKFIMEKESQEGKTFFSSKRYLELFL